jgi:hypothetical protein
LHHRHGEHSAVVALADLGGNMTPRATLLHTTLAATCIAFSTAAPAATISFADGTFDPSSLTTIFDPDNHGSVLTYGQAFKLGNPGVAYEMDASLLRSSRAAIDVVENNWVYDPAASGAVAGISFSQDLWEESNLGISTSAAIVAVVQDGVWYIHPIALSPQSAIWKTGRADQLQAIDFTSTAGQHPDFDRPIAFGWKQSFTSRAANPRTDYTSRVDNFEVTVTAVPEPGTLAMWVCGLGTAMILRRRGRSTFAVRSTRTSAR